MGMFQANANNYTSIQWQNMSSLWVHGEFDIICLIHSFNILNNQNSDYVCPLLLTNELLFPHLLYGAYPEKNKTKQNTGTTDASC